MMRQLQKSIALLIGMALLPAAARAGTGAEPATDSSLYAAFGREAGIAAIVDDFVDRVTKDPRVAKRFEGMNTKHFKEMSAQQFCEATGGPCVYHGKDMQTAHIGMHITDAEYDAVTEDLMAALDDRKVAKEAQQRFLKKRERHRSAIVAVAGNGQIATPAPPAAASGSPSATLLRAQDFQDAAKILELADSARTRGNLSLAARLFYSVELLVGSEVLADLHALYATGTPPRVQTPVARLAVDTPKQPRVVHADQEEGRGESGSVQNTISGTLVVAGKRMSDGLGLVTLRPLDRPARSRAPLTRTMEQRGRDFAPHLLVIPVGSTVSFPNFDPIYHNVYSSSETRPFDLGVYRNGESRDIRFDKAGLVQVECSVHENMVAYIAVVSDPYMAVVEDGTFSLRLVPPGRYLVHAWTEHSGKTTEKEVVVRAGKSVLAIEVDGHASDRMRTDKFGNPRK
jgi:truncated hemoglobin YjbI/plastocyanin